jgi:hypothetical protein
MKMVKKCMIALAVVALLATAANAQKDDASGGKLKIDPGDWPFTFAKIDLCTFPVLMDIGRFVEIKDCHKRELRLQQVSCPSGRGFPCHSGCEDFEARANFDAIFGARFDKNDLGNSVVKKTKLFFKDDINQITGDGGWHKLTICLDTWESELFKAGQFGDKKKVGTITIDVKPPDSTSP